MKTLFILLLLLPSLASAQEAWVDDVSVVEEPTETYVDPLEERIAALEANSVEIVSAMKDMTKAIGMLAEKASEKPVAMPSQCQCDCDCPTLDEIRQVVREELKAVTVTLKTASGEVKKVEVPLTSSAPRFKQIQPGEVVVAINGQSVTPHRYMHNNAPVTQYTTPSFDMRVVESPRGFFGAVRQSTCRIVNGVKVCN